MFFAGARLMLAHPMTPAWPMIDVLRLGAFGEDALLGRLAADASCAQEMHGGATLLHHATGLPCSLRVARALIAAWPEAVRMMDGEQRLPVHWAMMTHVTDPADGLAYAELIALLVGEYPESRRMGMGDGGGQTLL